MYVALKIVLVCIQFTEKRSKVDCAKCFGGYRVKSDIVSALMEFQDELTILEMIEK